MWKTVAELKEIEKRGTSLLTDHCLYCEKCKAWGTAQIRSRSVTVKHVAIDRIRTKSFCKNNKVLPVRVFIKHNASINLYAAFLA